MYLEMIFLIHITNTWLILNLKCLLNLQKVKTIEKLTKNINRQLIELKTLLDSLKILRSLNFPGKQRNTSKNFGEIHFVYRW